MNIVRRKTLIKGMLRKNPEHRPSASEILKHPYLQPYVDQCRSSFTPAVTSPAKPLRGAHDIRKIRAESQSSNSSCSDKDSLMSSEKNIQVQTCNCNHKVADPELVSGDDEVGIEQFLRSTEEHGSHVCTVRMEEQEVVKPIHDEQRSDVDTKHPKTIKHIMMALKEGKTRENSSPMRGNGVKPGGGTCTQRSNVEASPKVPKIIALTPGLKANADTLTLAPPAKASMDTVKRSAGLNPLKHQLPVIDPSPKTKPRHEGIPPSGSSRHIAEDRLPPKPRLKTPPNLLRRSSFPGRMKQLGVDAPDSTTNNKIVPSETVQDPRGVTLDAVPRNGPLTRFSRKIIQDSQGSGKGTSKDMQTESSNSVSVSIQGFELCDDASTHFSNLTELVLTNHEQVSRAESLESNPPSCSDASSLHSEMPELLFGETYQHNHKSVRFLDRTTEAHFESPSTNAGIGYELVRSSIALESCHAPRPGSLNRTLNREVAATVNQIYTSETKRFQSVLGYNRIFNQVKSIT